MRLHSIKAVIISIIACLISYAFYSSIEGEHRLFYSAGSLLFFLPTLIFGVAVEYPRPRTALNMKVLSLTFFLGAFVTNLVFAAMFSSTIAYLVVLGIAFMLYALGAYLIIEAKE